MEPTVNPKLASANRVIREAIRNQLQHAAPELYAEYQKIKYPGGKGSGTDTPETRTKATLYLFDMAREVIAPHYVQNAAQLDEVVEGEDEQFDDHDQDEDHGTEDEEDDQGGEGEVNDPPV